MFSSTVNSTQQANELEHLELMVFTSPFVIFFFNPHSLLPFFSLLHATDVFPCRSNRQESTGKKKRLDLPQERGVQSPQSAYSRCRKPVHLPPARSATWASEISHKRGLLFTYLFITSAGSQFCATDAESNTKAPSNILQMQPRSSMRDTNRPTRAATATTWGYGECSNFSVFKRGPQRQL